MIIIILTGILALLLSSLGFVYRFYFSTKLENGYLSSFFKDLNNSFMYVVSIQLQQGELYLSILSTKSGNLFISIFSTISGSRLGSDKMARLTFRIVLGLWLLMTVVLINLYTGTITSYLTVTKLEPIATTLEDLVNHYEQRHKKCMLTMQKGHPLMYKLRVSWI